VPALAVVVTPRAGRQIEAAVAWTIVAVFEDAAAVQAEPFGDIAFDLGRLWADGPPDPTPRG
jgi:hypothetical protein